MYTSVVFHNEYTMFLVHIAFKIVNCLYFCQIFLFEQMVQKFVFTILVSSWYLFIAVKSLETHCKAFLFVFSNKNIVYLKYIIYLKF